MWVRVLVNTKNHSCCFTDRAIRNQACELKDTAYAIIEAEMDNDFEKECIDIKESRVNRGIVKIGSSQSQHSHKRNLDMVVLAGLLFIYSVFLEVASVISTPDPKFDSCFLGMQRNIDVTTLLSLRIISMT